MAAFLCTFGARGIGLHGACKHPETAADCSGSWLGGFAASDLVQTTEDIHGSYLDWWSALGMQLLTLLAFVQQAPYALRRCRAFMFALMDAWSALSGSEVAIVEDLCTKLLHGFENRPRVQDGSQDEPQPHDRMQPVP